MTVHAHAVVWLDHHEAKIIQFNADAHEVKHLKHNIGKPAHKDRKDPGGAHPERGGTFYHDVACALAGVREILVCGPGAAKTEFVKHLQTHDPVVAKAVLGVEAADHPTEGQVLAHARQFAR